MTFHAGNGVTLTKDEENLPEEEKRKLTRQKEEQLNYERHVDDDLKDMVDRGDAAALAEENAKIDKRLGGAKDYGLGNVDGSKTQEAVDLVNGMHNGDVDEAMDLVNGGKSKTASGQQKDGVKSAQQAEYGQGAFGTLKNEDFTQYRKDKAARQAAAREARRASNEAMAAKRKELLSSGRYFDNGRGQIMLKKQYRQYATGTDWRHRHLRTAADDGSGMAAIREAGRSAWDEALQNQAFEQTEGAVNYSRSAVQANRLAAEERKAAKAEAAATSAKAKLSVFDGFAAALDALNADSANAEDNVVSVWGGKDEKGRDARWTYDEQGRVTGQADARQVVRGKKLESGGVQQTEGNFRKGFVDPVVLKAINSQLQKRGADYAVTGIMARQAFGAIGKPVAGSKPMFYIQGLRNDGTQFGQYMTIDDVYRWGVENYRAANGENGDARQFAIEALGGYDPEGLRKGNGDNWHENVARIYSASKEKITGMNNASKEKIAAQTEAGRNARFAMRNDREWEKLAQGWEKIDNDFAVRMRRADAYGKRVDILEQKLKNDYDIALKKAKTADERAKVEADYKDRMASVAEGNFDLNWFKAETAADQGQQKLDNDKAAKDADREMRLIIEEVRAYGRNGSSSGGSVSKSDLKRVQEIQKTIAGGNLTGENRTKLRNELNKIVSKYRPEEAVNLDNQAPIKPGDNTGDETKIPEFDPNKKDYKAGDHFVRNGIEYEVGSDGQPHKVSK